MTTKEKNLVTVDSLTLVFNAFKAICFGYITGSYWQEYTPIDEHKKPGKKVAVIGVVDGNKICKYSHVVRQSDKIQFCKLLNLVLQNMKKYATPDIKAPVLAGKDITWVEFLMPSEPSLLARGVGIFLLPSETIHQPWTL